MTPQIQLIRDTLSPTIERYAETLGRTLAQTMRRAAKGINRRVLAITPPGSAGTTGAAARRQGQQRIARQMSHVLAPVRLKGRRRITVVFGRKIARPVFVKTRERVPDVAAHYRRELRKNAAGTGLVLRNPGRKVWVDVRKFEAELKRRQGAVGRLASGWAEGARVLEVPVQQWVARHGTGRGAIRLNVLTAQMGITVYNRTANLPGPLRAEMDRRILAAVNLQREAMEREINYMVFKQAQAHAIKTRNFSALVPEGMEGAGPSLLAA